MKKKLTYCVMVVVGLFVLNMILHQVVVPQDTTALALQQMNEDGSREKMRVIDRLSNYITPSLVVIGGAAVLGICCKREGS